jgi:hypothetical protein
MILRWFSIFAFVGASPLLATTWQTDGSASNVQFTHDVMAVDGDTLTIPIGTFHWPVTVVISKAITVQGTCTTDVDAGTAVKSTVIIDDLTSNNPLIRMGNQNAGIHTAGGMRITGIDWEPGIGTTKLGLLEYNDGSIAPNAPIRVDHNYFGDLALTPWCLNLAYRNYGVFDHNVRHNTRQAGPVGCYWGRNTADKGDYDWEQPAGFGGPNFFFVETNWFQDATDISFGGKLCVRYNHIHGNGAITSGHLVEHGPGRSIADRQGGRAYEVYNNDFHFPGVGGFSIDGWDSGSHVWHDNTYENAGVFLRPTNSNNLFRMAWNWSSPFEGTNGVGWDVYATEPDGTHIDGHPPFVFETGTVTSATSGTLTDTSKSWTPNLYIGYVITRLSDRQVAGIDANTSNTISLKGIGFNWNWVPGDQYKILKVLKVFDGLGYGQGNPINRANPSYPNYASEPCYCWNNRNPLNGDHIVFDSPAYMKYIWRAGIEFFNDTVKPGYTPYVYPHPLVSGPSPSPTPSATPTPTPSPTPTATATPTVTPTATPTATVTPSFCVVPNFIGKRMNRAQTIWGAAGFTSLVNMQGTCGSTVVYQSIPAGTRADCNTAQITVRTQ